jgi:hypothetical protein
MAETGFSGNRSSVGRLKRLGRNHLCRPAAKTFANFFARLLPTSALAGRNQGQPVLSHPGRRYNGGYGPKSNRMAARLRSLHEGTGAFWAFNLSPTGNSFPFGVKKFSASLSRPADWDFPCRRPESSPEVRRPTAESRKGRVRETPNMSFSPISPVIS